MKTSTAAMASGELSPVALAWGSWPRRIAEQRALWKHFGRHWYVYLPLLFVYLWALDHIGVNWTPSLPYHVVYIDKHVSVGRGDLVVFRFEGGEIANHFKGQRFFKRIAGVAGDEITLQGRNIFINGAHVGYLSREDAVWYRPVFAALAAQHLVGVARAKLIGGVTDKPSIGVMLDLLEPVELQRQLDEDTSQPF